MMPGTVEHSLITPQAAVIARAQLLQKSPDFQLLLTFQYNRPTGRAAAAVAVAAKLQRAKH